MLQLFKNEYGVDDREIKTFLSPGRVNLIGEHIDYNGGFVFPGALTVGIYAALALRDDSKIRMRSKNVAGEVIIDLDNELVYKKEDDWGNYPKGVIKELRRRHPESNIVAIDFDPGASEVNQLNRIKLMLSTAFKNLEK